MPDAEERQQPTLPLLAVPDPAVLATINPLSQADVQPGWIRDEYPDYVQEHEAHQAMVSVREFTHEQHRVKITTSYQVEIDDHPVQLHVVVDNDGRVLSHIMPFETYASATDMIRTLLTRLPDAFAGLDDRQPPHHAAQGEEIV